MGEGRKEVGSEGEGDGRGEVGREGGREEAKGGRGRWRGRRRRRRREGRWEFLTSSPLSSSARAVPRSPTATRSISILF